MLKLIDKISGVIYENNFKYILLELGHDLIENYKNENIETYIEYKGNGVYNLKQYLIEEA